MARITSKLDDLDQSSAALMALLDESRLAGLDGLHTALADELYQSDHEAARLAVKYGEHSTAVAQYQASLADLEPLQAGIAADLQALLSGPPPAKSDDGQVAGRVTDAAGLGVDGARVVARTAEDKVLARATTDPSGSYRLALGVTEPASVLLEVSKRGDVLHQDGAAFRVESGTVVWRHIPIDS
jgi:hypothetical protein